MTDGSPADATQLREMRETLDKVLLVIRSTADEFKGDFADPSPARTDWMSCAPKLAVDLEQAYRTAMVLWHSIEDHGHGLSELIEARRTYSSMTLARSLGEGAARSWYMLEEVGVDPIERVRRLINERLYACHENEALYIGLLPSLKNAPEVAVVAKAKESVIRDRIASVRADRQSLLDAARGYELFPIKNTKGKVPYVGGGPRPGAMPLIGRVLDSASQGASFFRVNSSIAHFSLHGQVRMINFSRSEDGNDLSRARPMNPDDLAAAVWPGVGAMALAALAMFRQAGWRLDPLDVAIRQLAVAWNPPPSDELRAELDALR